MKRLLAVALVFAACRTAAPPAGEQPVTPLQGPAQQQLIERRDQFQGERSVVRIRTTNGVQTQSARAQLQVGRNGEMLITVYAPVVNMSAVRLYAANSQIVFLNDVEKTAWQGPANEFTGSFGFLGSDPSALAFLILGLPPRDASAVAYGESGLQSARLQDAVIAYDPAVYPPKRLVIVRGAQRVEIDHLEDYVSPSPIPPLTVPADYRCCVLPKMQ